MKIFLRVVNLSYCCLSLSYLLLHPSHHVHFTVRAAQLRPQTVCCYAESIHCCWDGDVQFCLHSPKQNWQKLYCPPSPSALHTVWTPLVYPNNSDTLQKAPAPLTGPLSGFCAVKVCLFTSQCSSDFRPPAVVLPELKESTRVQNLFFGSLWHAAISRLLEYAF